MNRKERRAKQSSAARARARAQAAHDRNMAEGMGEQIKRTQKPRQFATIKNAWDDLIVVSMQPHVLDPSSRQYIEMRRMFYAGIRTLFDMIHAHLDPEFEPTEEDLLRMSDWHEEVEQFFKDVLEGKA